MSLFSAIFRRDKAGARSLSAYVDHHSHILPGVDDGFRCIDDSLKCIDTYERWGFAEIWLTPHIMEDFPNTTDSLRARFDELSAAYKGPVKLHLASENMIDTLFVERLANNDFLPMGDRLLVETSYFDAPENFHEVLEEIKKKGYRPLLAHPERYHYMDFDEYENLLSKGIEFQLNIFSLLGMYGTLARENARHLLKQGAYTLSGTDVHNLRQTEALNELIKDNAICQAITSLK